VIVDVPYHIIVAVDVRYLNTVIDDGACSIS